MNTYKNIKKNTRFNPPHSWKQIKTIDMHTGGEPLRIILEEGIEIEEKSVLAYRRAWQEHHDWLRTALMYEPRGHRDMYGCHIVPPNDPEADFGVVFMHNEGYSTMCGHAIIAVSTLAVEMQWIPMQEGENLLKIDAPCGRIISYTQVENGKVQGVRFQCVPSFVLDLDVEIEVPGIGKINFDIAYGGAFYAYVDLSKNNLNLELEPSNVQDIIDKGMTIKKAIMQSDQKIEHPFEPELGFLYGCIFIDKSKSKQVHSRNVCVFAEGEVDRSPTGSGVSGRIAIHHARGQIKPGEKICIESITGSRFSVSIIAVKDYGSYQAIIPEVEGSAYITGAHTFMLDPKDPIKNGFLLR